VTEDQLQMHFEMVRQSIGTWAATTAELVGAASEADQTGTSNPERFAAAERMLAAVRSERAALEQAATAVPGKSDDLARGIEIALNELDLLERDIGQALGRLAS
jgi:hypothetical protein